MGHWEQTGTENSQRKKHHPWMTLLSGVGVTVGALVLWWLALRGLF
jgi:hypothetical protein